MLLSKINYFNWVDMCLVKLIIVNKFLEGYVLVMKIWVLFKDKVCI